MDRAISQKVQLPRSESVKILKKYFGSRKYRVEYTLDIEKLDLTDDGEDYNYFYVDIWVYKWYALGGPFWSERFWAKINKKGVNELYLVKERGFLYV